MGTTLHNKMKKMAGISSLFGLSLLLAACNQSGTSKPADALGGAKPSPEVEKANDLANDPRAFCPKTVIRAGTETIRTFENGVKKTDPGALNSLRFQGTINKVDRECNYSPANLNIRVGIAGRVINGPTGATGTFEMPVRVAVVRGTEPVYSKLHRIPVTLAGSNSENFSFIDSEINLPIPEKPNLLIYVGYDEGPYDTQ